MVDSEFEDPKALTKMQLDNKNEIADMQNETQKEIAGILFFFQAEDGIRDHCVTGVQTCALPIWLRSTSCRATRPSTRAVMLGGLTARREASAEEAADPSARSASTRYWGSDSSAKPRASSTRLARQIGRASCRERMEVATGLGA